MIPISARRSSMVLLIFFMTVHNNAFAAANVDAVRGVEAQVAQVSRALFGDCDAVTQLDYYDVLVSKGDAYSYAAAYQASCSAYAAEQSESSQYGLEALFEGGWVGGTFSEAAHRKQFQSNCQNFTSKEIGSITQFHLLRVVNEKALSKILAAWEACQTEQDFVCFAEPMPKSSEVAVQVRINSGNETTVTSSSVSPGVSVVSHDVQAGKLLPDGLVLASPGKMTVALRRSDAETPASAVLNVTIGTDGDTCTVYVPGKLEPPPPPPPPREFVSTQWIVGNPDRKWESRAACSPGSFVEALTCHVQSGFGIIGMILKCSGTAPTYDSFGFGEKVDQSGTLACPNGTVAKGVALKSQSKFGIVDAALQCGTEHGGSNAVNIYQWCTGNPDAQWQHSQLVGNSVGAEPTVCPEEMKIAGVIGGGQPGFGMVDAKIVCRDR